MHDWRSDVRTFLLGRCYGHVVLNTKQSIAVVFCVQIVYMQQKPCSGPTKPLSARPDRRVHPPTKATIVAEFICCAYKPLNISTPITPVADNQR